MGVPVKDIQDALKLFQDIFGAPTAVVEELLDQGARATVIQVGQTRLELLEPLTPDSPVRRFIERRGEGLHHLATNIPDVAGKLRALDTQEFELIDKNPGKDCPARSLSFIPAQCLASSRSWWRTNGCSPQPA